MFPPLVGFCCMPVCSRVQGFRAHLALAEPEALKAHAFACDPRNEALFDALPKLPPFAPFVRPVLRWSNHICGWMMKSSATRCAHSAEAHPRQAGPR